MKRRKPKAFSNNPFLAWTNLAWKTNEMLLASSQVINHRVQRMATAGAIPDKRDQREFTLMGQEKIEAAAESAFAIVLHMTNMSQQIGTQAVQNMISVATRTASVAASRTLLESTNRQTEMMKQALGNSAAIASKVSEAIAHANNQGLKPIHSRATRNAKRLQKVKQRLG